MSKTVAALFVRRKNHYSELGCDCFDYKRDALTWSGGQPGVFHPPCRSWSQLSHFARPEAGERDLAIWAMEKVRAFGGVLEHPYNSRLWFESGCLSFGVRDQFGGVLFPVFQSWFGHDAPKKTGLYLVGASVPDLSQIIESAPAPSRTVERMCKAGRERTPLAFAKFLVELAQSCEVNHG